MKIGCASSVGKRRDLDEDSIAILQSDTLYESKRVQIAFLVLCDGMGGHNAGEIASYLAAKQVAEEMARAMLKKDAGEFTFEKVAPLFQEVVGAANRRIHAYAEENPQYRGMGTTVTAAFVYGNTVYIGHVGDSRAYLINKKEVNQITKDHSLVQELVDSGEITKEEARIHDHKNIITRAVGITDPVEVDTFEKKIHPGDVLLLCCDGLTDLVTDEEIHNAVMEYDDPQKICTVLVETANERGGFDNISVIVAKVDGLHSNILEEKTVAR